MRKLIVPMSTCLAFAACDQKPAPEKTEDSPSATSPAPAAPSAKEKPIAMKEAESSLAEQLAARAKNFGTKSPEDVKTKYAAGLQAVIDSQTVDKAIQVGESAPAFQLKNAMGQEVSLSTLLKKGPVILMWYRGGWCPYCNLTLRAMQKKLPEFQKKGAQLVAISPELPDKTLSTSEKHELKFNVLSDPKNEVAEKYRIVFELTPDVAEIYQRKFQLHEWNGSDSNKLPLAATYVIAQDGKVHWAFLNADYRERAEPSEVLKALESL